jgi:hypothetical protein
MNRLAFCLVMGFAAGGVSVADEIRLKTGKTINGTVSKYDKGKFSVIVNGNSQEIKNTTVDSIDFGAVGGNVATDELLSLANCEKGKEGFLKPTLTVQSTDDGRFIGARDIVAEGIVRGSQVAIIQGIDTSSLVSGNFVKLMQRLRCVGTENLADGKTVYVFEPVDPAQNQVTKAENPALSRPVSGGVRVQDIRGR